MEASYTLIHHSADMGLQLQAPDLPQLIPVATQGMYEIIGALVPVVEQSLDKKHLSFSCFDPAYALRDYLAEILFLLQNRDKFLRDFIKIEFSSSGLSIQAKCSALNRERSEFYHEIKAVTYHELSVKRVADHYEAQVIFDL